MNNKDTVHQFSEGELCFWIEQETSIHLKAVTSHGDPVELTATEARIVAQKLLECAERLKNSDSN